MNKPSDSVRIVIFHKHNRDQFLVLSETDDPDNLKLPGGKFESEAETPDEASRRELFEEIGLAIEQVNLQSAGVD